MIQIHDRKVRTEDQIREETLEDRQSQTCESQGPPEFDRNKNLQSKKSMILQGSKYTPFLSKVIEETNSANLRQESSTHDLYGLNSQQSERVQNEDRRVILAKKGVQKSEK